MSTYYKKSDPSVVVEILEEKESFYQLSDGQMIKKDVFPKYYIKNDDIGKPVNESVKSNVSNDNINPEDFFNTSIKIDNSAIEQLKNTDPSKGVTDSQARTEIKHGGFSEPINPTDNDIVRQVDPKDQKIPNHTNTDVSSYKVYDDDDEAYNDFIKNKSKQNTQKPSVQQEKSDLDKKIEEINLLYDDELLTFGKEEADKRKSSRLKRLNIPKEQNITQENIIHQEQPQQFDPAQMMFKSFKRNHDITINIKIEDKIGNPDFIKMMMENMDGDIVGFYKKAIMDKILNDLSIIEDEVEKNIKYEIYGDDYKEVISDNDNSGVDLIPGGKTKSGKQKYKYINNNGDIIDMLPTTAEKKGYKPYKKD